MRINETELPGAFLIELERRTDERGFFARSWCAEEFRAYGLNSNVTQCNVVHSHRKGTVRGMHLQLRPHEEVKLVRCVRGMIHDVIVDLRRDSPTFRRWISAVLTADNDLMLYIPEGFGHGCQTLADETEIVYQASAAYHPESATGIRHDDPAFDFEWPLPVQSVSQQDRRWLDFNAVAWRDKQVATFGGVL